MLVCLCVCVLLRVWSERGNKARFCCVEIYGEVLKEDHLRMGQVADMDALGSIKKKKTTTHICLNLNLQFIDVLPQNRPNELIWTYQ